MDKVDDFVNAEDTLQALVEPRKWEPRVERKSSSGDKKAALNHQDRRHERRQEYNTLLIHNNLNVQEKEESEREYRQPKTCRRYSKYHQTSSHWTEDCTTMKKRVTELASTGELEQMVTERAKPKRRFERGHDSRRSSNSDRWRPSREDARNNNRDRVPQNNDRDRVSLGKIRTIASGFAGGDTSSSSRRAHARRARYEETYVACRLPKHRKLDISVTISFGEEDCE
ncbi:uncharacterized protein LOC121249312 [Juglans microcarpa x Juglans regia]|uniref:uncharacterized protein LOC121249312 n=1 Tax=Juglans microcarpa x Juglans regia TaxID=2249226 RepID=UPI001B7DD04E|nr:uncharacterized protein LOC121249312 [Juglans microcarpa x Juglans regia]